MNTMASLFAKFWCACQQPDASVFRRLEGDNKRQFWHPDYIDFSSSLDTEPVDGDRAVQLIEFC